MHAQPGVRARPDTPVAEHIKHIKHMEHTAHSEPNRRLPASIVRSRHAALSDQQRDTWERRWPEIGVSLGPEPIEPMDIAEWFGRRAPLVLEIGCGNGASTLAMAQDEPDIDVIAVEIYRRGLAQLLSAIERAQVSNIRLIRGNGIDVLERLVAPGSLTGVRVFFPDPWPKARHHKRRFLQSATVDLIADRLLPGGVLHAATDHPGYAEHIAAVGDAESRLLRVDPGNESLPISVIRPTTKYETKAQEAGSEVTELIWKRQ